MHGKKERTCHFHDDNCVGQNNKNKSVLAYFMWHTIVGLNDEITLSFMRVGHTRCLVDACFGLLNKRYRSSECDTMEHLKTTVELSAKGNSVQLFDWEWRALFSSKASSHTQESGKFSTLDSPMLHPEMCLPALRVMRLNLGSNCSNEVYVLTSSNLIVYLLY